MHVSLDSALGRQRRLNSVGESVLQIAPNAAAAYSLRSLTGGDPKVVRVRRDTDGGAGDNDEQDFTASEVFSGALAAFVGSGNDGFVETWYDQSGNSKDAVQETAANQPLLVASGVALSGLSFDGSTSSRTLVAPSVTGLAGSLSIFSVSVRDATGNTVSLSNSSSGGRYFAIQEGGSTSVANPRNTASITVSDSVSGANRLTFAVTTGATSTSVGANSSAVTTSTSDYGDDFSGTHINQIAIGVLRTASPTGYFNGRINEILVYNSDQTDNRTAVETNINSHYSLF